MKNLIYLPCTLIALLLTACAALEGANLIGPAGGFVFYDKGGYSEGWRYLEAAPENAGTDSWGKAEQLCGDYSHGGFDDWYLPDITELKELLDNNHGITTFNVGVYWSSTSGRGSLAWGIQNGDSTTPKGSSYSSGETQASATYDINNKFWVRPVRRF